MYINEMAVGEERDSRDSQPSYWRWCAKPMLSGCSRRVLAALGSSSDLRIGGLYRASLLLFITIPFGFECIYGYTGDGVWEWAAA